MKRGKVDLNIVISVTFLLFVGMVMVFSASSMMADKKFGSLTYYLRKQMMWGILSFGLMILMSRFDYRRLQHHKLPHILILLSFTLLIGLLVGGVRINGARRWFHLGFMNFQPSELAKLSIIIYTAYYLSVKKAEIAKLKSGILPLMFVLSLIILPVMLQPDLSTSLMLAIISGLMLFVSRARLKHLVGMGLSFIPAALFLMSSRSYQQGRISQWIHAWGNPLNAAYQIRQSLIGLGRGGWMGHGLGQSKQKFFFLPDSHTDFIFSILGEEWGFIGVTIILLVFMFLLYRGLVITRRVPDAFGKFLALGFTLNIVLYGLINAGVVSMLFPATGLPMPFISYGGSHLMFLGFSVGLLLSISRVANRVSTNGNWTEFRQKREQLYQTVISTD